MGSSIAMRSHEIVGVCQLVGECRELWADTDAWQTHLLHGACRLTQTTVGSFAELRLSPDHKTDDVLEEIDLGWRDAAARSHRQRMHAEHPDRVAFLPRCYQLAGRALDNGGVATLLRPEMRPDDDWYRSEIFNEYHRPAYIDDFVMSFGLNPRTGNLIYLQVCQDVSDPTPTRRTKSIVSLLVGRIAPLVGVELVTSGQRGVRGLSPRLRQTLHALLAGDSEKQIALRLGVSSPTAHEYVGALYRHFSVNSRAELMAYFIHRSALPSRATVMPPA